MLITPHFNLSEMTKTSTGLENACPMRFAGNLVRLCNALEHVRTLLGSPVVVHSGYRSEEVNAAVGGDKASAHLEARAADFHTNQPLRDAFEAIKASGIDFDKLILEPGWLHIAVPKLDAEPRRIAMVAERVNGRMTYRTVA